jgi:hypothetical protein
METKLKKFKEKEEKCMTRSAQGFVTQANSNRGKKARGVLILTKDSSDGSNPTLKSESSPTTTLQPELGSTSDFSNSNGSNWYTSNGALTKSTKPMQRHHDRTQNQNLTILSTLILFLLVLLVQQWTVLALLASHH